MTNEKKGISLEELGEDTQLQVAAVLLQTGTPEQVQQAEERIRALLGSNLTKERLILKEHAETLTLSERLDLLKKDPLRHGQMTAQMSHWMMGVRNSSHARSFLDELSGLETVMHAFLDEHGIPRTKPEGMNVDWPQFNFRVEFGQDGKVSMANYTLRGQLTLNQEGAIISNMSRALRTLTDNFLRLKEAKLESSEDVDFLLRVSFDEKGHCDLSGWNFTGQPTPEQRALVIECLEEATKEQFEAFPYSEESALALGTHRHYKGGVYRVLGQIRNADDADAPTRTLYQHIWPHARQMWHRNTEEFNSTLITGELRFKPIK